MSAPEKENPEHLALRAKPRPVTRLNRKTVLTLAAGLALTVVLALMWGLRSPKPKKTPAAQPSHNVEHVTRAEGLESLPKDYAAISKPPQLGAPIGEFGRPVLRAEQEAGIPLLPERPSFQPNPEEDALRAQRLREQSEAETAAKAQVIVKLERKQRAQEPSVDPAIVPSSAAHSAMLDTSTRQSQESDQNQQAHKQSFAYQEPDQRIYATAALQRPQSPYQLMAGSVIPAALITGIKSDLPGQVIASVTENVYDTVTHQFLLIPQGSKLIGQYDSQITYGQQRVLLVWTRLIMPDGSSIVLDRLPASDTEGYSGLKDRVDWHWGRIFAGAALSTLLGVGAELAAPEHSGRDGTVIVATRESVQENINQVGQEITQRNLDLQPTLTVRPGLPLRVIVNRDLILRPYEE